ncbi:MAG: hypothetical protein AAB371_01685 [Patescibacteria group bacterium]
MYNVLIRSRAEKQFAKLSKDKQIVLFKIFQQLSENPFGIFHLKKLEGTDDGYRIVVGKLRILLLIMNRDKYIEIIDIFRRKEASDYKRRLGLFK